MAVDLAALSDELTAAGLPGIRRYYEGDAENDQILLGNLAVFADGTIVFSPFAVDSAVIDILHRHLNHDTKDTDTDT